MEVATIFFFLAKAFPLRASITQKKIWSSGFTNGWRCLKSGPADYVAQNYKKTFKFIQIMTINSKVLKISMTLLVAINLKATPRNLLLAERSRKPKIGLLGNFFWRKGRGNPGLAKYMGEKGG